MICTLRDELMQRCQEIMELETALSSAKQLVIKAPFFIYSCSTLLDMRRPSRHNVQ